MAFVQGLTFDGSADNTATFNVTGLVSAGDTLIFCSFTDSSTMTVSSPASGFSAVATISNTTDESSSMLCYIKESASGSETSLVFTHSAYNFNAVLLIFSGMDTSNVQDVTRVVSQGGAMDSSPWSQDVTIAPITDGATICVLYGSDTSAGATPTYSFSGGGLTWNQAAAIGTDSYFSLCAYYAEQPSAASVTITGTGTSSGDSAVPQVIAIALRPLATGQNAYPTSDISDGSWTPSTGSDLYATIDETSASDSDYDYVNSNSTMRVGLGALSTPAAGTRTLYYRIKGSAEKRAIARLIEGSTTVQSFTDDPIPETITTKSQTVTNSISDYSNLRFELEIADATTAPTPSVSFGAIGTGVNGSTSIAVGYPSGISAGDLLVIVATTGATNSETPGTPSGWTSQGSYATTDGTFGTDTGPRRVTVFTKEAAGGESGTVTVATTNGNTGRCTMYRFAKAHPSYAWDIAATGGYYGAGTSVSVTGGSLSFAPGDVVMVSNGQRVDTVTQSSQSLTASGITFGTRTNRANTAVTTGNDIRHVVDTYAAVTDGTATVAPTWSYTASATCSAAIHFLRLREVPPTEKARITWVKFNVPESGGLTLTVADLLHAQAIDSATLVQAHVLAISDILHAQAIEAATITQAHVLGPADARNTQAIDGATLNQELVLSLSDLTNAQAIDATTLTQQSVLSPADLSHGNAVESATLIQAHTLAIADITHAQAIDATTLIQQSVLSPSDLSQSQAIDAATLIQAHALAIADITHAQTLDNVALVVAGDISPADMMTAQAMDSPLLLQAHLLSPEDARNTQTIEQPGLTQAHSLTPADARNTQAIDSTTLVQSHVLIPAGMDHAVILDSPILVQAHVISPADLAQSQTLENVTLTVLGSLSVADLLNSQAMDAAGIVQAHLLSPADLLHAQAIEAATIAQAYTLTVADARNAQAMDATTLIQQSVLSPADARNAQAIEATTLIQAHTLAIADITHSQTIDALTLLQGFILVPADLLHGQTIDGALLDLSFGLTPADLLHAQGFESPGLVQAHVLFAADILQANRFDIAGVSSGFLEVPPGRAVIVGKSDRYVLLTPSDRVILLTPSDRVILLTPSTLSVVI